MSLRRHVATTGDGETDRLQGEADRPADRRVRPPAGPKRVVRRVDAQFASHRAVNDEQGRCGARRGLNAQQVERRVRDRRERGHDQRERPALAAGKDRAGGSVPGGWRHEPRRQRAEARARCRVGAVQHPLDTARGRRHHRETVGQAGVVEALVRLLEVRQAVEVEVGEALAERARVDGRYGDRRDGHGLKIERIGVPSACSTRRITVSVPPNVGIQHECLPGPPATMMSRSCQFAVR